MKSAKQIVFILIGTAMILLGVVLVFMKKSNDARNGVSGEGESGSKAFSMPISSLTLEAGACDIEILEGEGTEFLVDFEGLKYGTLTTEQEGEALKIIYKQDDNWSAKMFVDKDINDQRITLTVPENALLERAIFEFGAAEITMEGITAKELSMTVGAGELKADRLTATESAKFTVGAGSFWVEDASLTNAELECGLGKMDVSGTFEGDTKAECGMGSMEIVVNGEQEQYQGTLNCGVGKVDFGTISIKEGEKKYGTSSAECRMDIKCGIGKVDVRFYN